MKEIFKFGKETNSAQTDADGFPTRRAFLKSSSAAALTAITLSAAPVSVFGGNFKLSAQTADALNFALALEFLQDEFYRAALNQNGLIPPETRRVFERIGADEAAHVKLLRSLLGNGAITKPDFDFTAGGAFGDVFDRYDTFLAVAQVFEDTGARALRGQTDNLQSREISTHALRIGSDEARHAATIRRIRAGESLSADESNDAFASQSFDEPLTFGQVSEITNLFLKS